MAGGGISGIGNAVSDVLNSDLGKAAATAAAIYYGGPMLAESLGSVGGASALEASTPGWASVPGSGMQVLASEAPSAGISSLIPETLGGKVLAGTAGIGALGMLADRNKYGMPEQEKYSGPLSKFKYSPDRYEPYTYTPYAAGGPVEEMSNANAIGANTGFPMADISKGAYATPYQQPISQNVLTGPQDTRVDAYTGQERLAEGGIAHYDIGGEIGKTLSGVNNLLTNATQGRVSLADQPGTMSWDDPRYKDRLDAILSGKQYASGGIADLGGYSDGGRLLKGPGDGVSDSIPATIAGRQPARLADGEFVVPARIVSELGNGSTDAGARELYKMMNRVQSARGKTTGKGKMAKDTRATKYLPA